MRSETGSVRKTAIHWAQGLGGGSNVNSPRGASGWNGNTWVELAGFPDEESSTVMAPRQERGVHRGRSAEAGLGPQEGDRRCGQNSRGAASQYPLAWTLTDPVSRDEGEESCVPLCTCAGGCPWGRATPTLRPHSQPPWRLLMSRDPRIQQMGSWLFSRPLFFS